MGSAAINDNTTTSLESVPPDSLRFHSSAKMGGFATVTVTSEGLTLTHKDGDGTVLYTAPPLKPREKEWLGGAVARGQQADRDVEARKRRPKLN